MAALLHIRSRCVMAAMGDPTGPEQRRVQTRCVRLVRCRWSMAPVLLVAVELLSWLCIGIGQRRGACHHRACSVHHQGEHESQFGAADWAGRPQHPMWALICSACFRLNSRFFFCGSGSTLGDTKPTVTWLVRASNPGLILRYVVSFWLPTPPSGPSPPTLRCWCCSAAAGAGLSFAPSSRWLPSVTCTGTRVFLSAGRGTRNARDEPAAPTNVAGDAFIPEQAARRESTGLSAMRLAFTSCKM